MRTITLADERSIREFHRAYGLGFNLPEDCILKITREDGFFSYLGLFNPAKHEYVEFSFCRQDERDGFSIEVLGERGGL